MTQRGRKSEVSLGVVPQIERKRPKAPKCLTKAEAKEWDRIVNRMPIDWFPEETHPILENMCRHIVACEILSKQVSKQIKNNDDDTMPLNRLLSMRDRESKAVVLCATKLRLTNQSRVRAEKAGPAAAPGKKARPWEYTG